MGEGFPDLRDAVSAVYRQVRSAHLIWCVAADGFETTVFTRQGIILGGAWTPVFLRDTAPLASWGVPWTVTLSNSRLVLVESATAPLSDWLPLLEGIKQANESLLVIASAIDGTLLRTLTVNSVCRNLECCAVRVQPGAGSDDGIRNGGPGTPVPSYSKELPLTPEAWIRRSASVVFPMEHSAPLGQLSNLSVIAVGGKNHEHQQERLRFLIQAIEELDES